MNRFLVKHITEPVRRLLKSGVTPRELACAAALGITLGTIPVIGSSSLLCTLAAMKFRLNLPAIQLANWLASPLQLAFLVPFLHLGSYLFGVQEIPGSLDRIVELLTSDWLGTIGDYVSIVLRGVVVWLLIAPAMAAIVYGLTLPVLRRFVPAPELMVAVPVDPAPPPASFTGSR